MVVKSLIAAAVLIGTGSLALAQTGQYDGTGDKTLSYGRMVAPAAASAAPSSAVAMDPFNQYDGTGDKTLSYGARPN